MSHLHLTEPFPSFASIPRFYRDVTITEKIDGTNALVYVEPTTLEVFAGSRNRWLTLEKDNFGFAKWVAEHTEELKRLGPGRHYGEWYGLGIQRGYGLDHKRLALFGGRQSYEQRLCWETVPVLYHGPFKDIDIDNLMANFIKRGSCAVPGWMDPEGFVIFHHSSGQLFKFTQPSDGHKDNEQVRAKDGNHQARKNKAVCILCQVHPKNPASAGPCVGSPNGQHEWPQTT